MTEEELLLAERALRTRGYRYFYRISVDGRNRYHLRARKLNPRTQAGMRERPLEIRTPEDLAPNLRAGQE